MEDSGVNTTSYYDKVDGLARWFGDSVAAAFFASLEQWSCVNLTTSDTADEDEEAKDRPLMLTNLRSSSTSSFPSANHNVNNSRSAVDNLPV